MAPGEDSLKEAMDKYTRWIDDQIANVDQSVDQNEKNEKAKAVKDWWNNHLQAYHFINPQIKKAYSLLPL